MYIIIPVKTCIFHKGEASALTFMAVEFLRGHFNEKLDADVREVSKLTIDTSFKIREAA